MANTGCGCGGQETGDREGNRACGVPAPLVGSLGRLEEPWTDGVVDTPVGPVPRARTTLNRRDRFGTLRVRASIHRMNYRVPPGLYAVGAPTPDSIVLVTANFQLTFDRLRRVLGGRDAWILVLDTHGINVWCAAGKGTFGTEELARRVLSSGLARIVSHRRLIVPQLGATGVSAHEVRRLCGFSVVYGPVRAEDLPAFLDARLKASPEMRQVRFALRDRAVLIPVELAEGGKVALLVAAAFLLAGGLGMHGYSAAGIRAIGLPSAALLLGAFLAGTILGPILLPWLPGRAFALKGAWLGAALVTLLAVLQAATGGAPGSPWHTVAWALLIPTVTSFFVMTFTGASTFTSLSGVLREMRFAVPAQIGAGVIGLAFWFVGLFAA